MHRLGIGASALRSASQLILAVGLACTLLAPAAAQHAGDILVGSSAAGGGALVARFAFPAQIALAESFRAGGLTLYGATDPGFDVPAADDPVAGTFRLASGTTVSLELTAIGEGCPPSHAACASLKVGASTLDAAGESAVLGAMPDLHIHPTWQLTLPDGSTAAATIRFRLTSSSGTYSPSAEYAVAVRNGAASPTPTPATVAPLAALRLQAPAARGDQLVLLYDARPGRATFLNLANAGEEALVVRLSLYGPELAPPFSTDTTIAARGTRTVSVDGLVAAGLPAQAGIATATALSAAGEPVVSRALSGSFTVANVATQSAWGAPAAARAAMRMEGGASMPAGLGDVIDGRSVLLQQVRPDALDLAVFYDPLDLGPAELGGNEVVLLSFADVAGDALAIVPAPTTWQVSPTSSSGVALPRLEHVTSGAGVTHLAAIAGAGVDGSAGGLVLAAAAGSAPNRLAYFSESLGTFATGYGLPAVSDADLETPPARDRAEPAARGDQLVLYYDARNGFTTFLNLANQGETSLSVEVVLYGPLIDAPLRRAIQLPARATRTLDVAALRGEGMPARAGIALVAAVDGAGRPVASQALAGSFTVANLATASAWGAPAVARTALREGAGGVEVAPPGSIVDGEAVSFDRVAPAAVDLAVYYDPAALAPAEIGGNQIALVSFADATGGVHGAAPATTRWRVDATRSSGSGVASAERDVAGVEVTHLVELLGGGAAGAAGHVRFDAVAGEGNRLVFFVQSLGTFATGYRLPAVEP
jgi:hypothetical protein